MRDPAAVTDRATNGVNVDVDDGSDMSQMRNDGSGTAVAAATSASPELRASPDPTARVMTPEVLLRALTSPGRATGSALVSRFMEVDDFDGVSGHSERFLGNQGLFMNDLRPEGRHHIRYGLRNTHNLFFKSWGWAEADEASVSAEDVSLLARNTTDESWVELGRKTVVHGGAPMSGGIYRFELAQPVNYHYVCWRCNSPNLDNQPYWALYGLMLWS